MEKSKRKHVQFNVHAVCDVEDKNGTIRNKGEE